MSVYVAERMRQDHGLRAESLIGPGLSPAYRSVRGLPYGCRPLVAFRVNARRAGFEIGVGSGYVGCGTFRQ